MSSKNTRNSSSTLGNFSLGAWPWKDAPWVSEADKDLDAAAWEGKGTAEMRGHGAGGRTTFSPYGLLSPLVLHREDQVLRWHRLVPLLDPSDMPRPPAQDTLRPSTAHGAARSSAPSSPPGTSGRGGGLLPPSVFPALGILDGSLDCMNLM